MVDLEEPDKGRAWMIALAACIINMILSGLSRMVGILYVAVIDTYGVSRAEATLPFTVRNSIRGLSGPLVGIVGQRFGIRTVTIWGGVIASAGAGLCCIAPNVVWLTVFWGGMHGVGFALANTLFQVVVNQYFQKYRATASGIALSGACVGSLGFPILIEGILDTYGLSGGFLILGGIVMNVLPPSLLLCSPQWVEYPKAYARLWALKNSNASVETVNTIVDKESEIEENEFLGRKLARTTSLSNCPVESVGVSAASIDNLYKKMVSGIFSNNEGLKTENNKKETYTMCTLSKVKESSLSERKVEMQEEEAASSHAKENSDVCHMQDNLANHSEGEGRPHSTVKIPARKQNTQSILQSLKSIAKLYTNPMYVLISVCMTTYVIIFIPILTVVVDYSKDKGIPESYGKFLINAMALGDLAGRLCFGWITDRKIMTLPCFMTLILVLEGTFIALFPFAMSVSSFTTLLVLYSMTAGSLLVLFPVLVLQYVDMNAQSVAIASVGFLSGILSFGIPPMIGHFRDEVGSYDGMFFLTGIISVVSGGMWLLEPILLKFHCVRKEKQEAEEEDDISSFQNNHKDLHDDKMDAS